MAEIETLESLTVKLADMEQRLLNMERTVEDLEDDGRRKAEEYYG